MSAFSDAPFDLLTIGRIGVDIDPMQIGGVSLRNVATFGKFLGGGSATNVAVAAARYGRRTAVITRTGSDHDLYYLNFMAGPGERVWRFCDDPAHTWIRAAWDGSALDPRVPMTSAVASAGHAR